MQGYLVTTTLALVAVSALAVFALRLLGAARRGARRGAGPLQVVARLGLEAHRSVVVIEAGGRCFLVGMGAGPMALLAELDPKSMVSPELADERTNVIGEAFRRVLLGARSPR